MNKKDALAEIQKMHETREVTRESIIGWYSFYSHKLPKMKPERSDDDLIRTIALWMDLTDKGGRPPFPYDYKSKLNLESLEGGATNPNISKENSLLFKKEAYRVLEWLKK